MLTWHAITSTEYYAATADQLDDEALYFLSDTQEFYKGSKPFNEAVVIYSGALPEKPARRRIYINSANGEGKVYTGTKWVTVIKAVSATLSATDTSSPVSGKAVADYVTEAIEDVTGGSGIISAVTYDKENLKLTVTKGDGTKVDSVLENLGATIAYDKTTGALTLKDVSGNVLGNAVNLDLERFVRSAGYDDTKKEIWLKFDEAESSTDVLTIPVGDLVDTYTAGNSKSIRLTVTGNKFVAEAIVSAAEGNMLQATDGGLFVAAVDTSNFQTLVTTAKTNAVPMLNAQGQVINGTHTLGGATIAEAPTATVLATELAVKALLTAARTELEESLATKMALVTAPEVTKVPMLNAQGQVINGTHALGGDALSATPNGTTLATEKAVKDAITSATENMLETTDVSTAIDSSATNDKVASAKAVYDALVWKTTL